MQNFKDYAKNLSNEAKSQNIPDDEMRKAQNVINKYAGYDENQLAKELAQTIKQQKNNKMYDRNKIIKQIDKLSGYMTEEQKKSILGLLDNAENK